MYFKASLPIHVRFHVEVLLQVCTYVGFTYMYATIVGVYERSGAYFQVSW